MLISRLKTYWDAVGAAKSAINGVYHGDADEIIEQVNNDLTYPIMWVETPDCTIGGDADHAKIPYKGYVVVLDQLNRDRDNKSAVIDSTQQIGLSILHQLQQDARSQRATIELKGTSMYQVNPYFIDGVVGWRISYTISAPLDLSPYCAEYEKITI